MRPDSTIWPVDTEQHTFREIHKSHLSFNVMPGKPVQEVLHVHTYTVGDRYAEARFDRTYQSSMDASPSHLIFLSALVHTQKLLYLCLCRELGFDYDPDGPERIKIWPTRVEVRIPELITRESELVQKLWIRELKQFDATTYRASIETRIGSLQITSVCPVFIQSHDEPASRAPGDR